MMDLSTFRNGLVQRLSAKCPNQTTRMRRRLWKSFQAYRGPVASLLLALSFPDQVSKKKVVGRKEGRFESVAAIEVAPDEEETRSVPKNLLTDPQAGLTALESFFFGGRGGGCLLAF